MLTPRINRIVEQEARRVRQSFLRYRFGCMKNRRVRRDGAKSTHTDLLTDLEQPLFRDNPAPFIDLVCNVDLDRTDLGT